MLSINFIDPSVNIFCLSRRLDHELAKDRSQSTWAKIERSKNRLRTFLQVLDIHFSLNWLGKTNWWRLRVLQIQVIYFTLCYIKIYSRTSPSFNVKPGFIRLSFHADKSYLRNFRTRTQMVSISAYSGNFKNFLSRNSSETFVLTLSGIYLSGCQHGNFSSLKLVLISHVPAA